MAGNNKIQILRGTSVKREASNANLLAGQPFYETDTGKFYVGNGGAIKSATPVVATPEEHSHTVESITDLTATATELNYCDGVTSSIQTQLNAKASKSHASTGTTYGLGTSSNYGHVKISNGDVATVASVNGVAAGMNHTHSSYALSEHKHDDKYAPLNHDHDDKYAPLNHDHDGEYAPNHSHESLSVNVNGQEYTYDTTEPITLPEFYAPITSKGASLSGGVEVLRANEGGGPTWKAIVDLVYPIGSIYMSVSSTNPGTLFGGTWVAWGAGRVPVGVDSKQYIFQEVEKTGGTNYHRHNTAEATSGANIYNVVLGETYSGAIENHYLSDGVSRYVVSNNNLSRGTPLDTSGSGSYDSSLQPYITCYMWKRTR